MLDDGCWWSMIADDDWLLLVINHGSWWLVAVNDGSLVRWFILVTVVVDNGSWSLTIWCLCRLADDGFMMVVNDWFMVVGNGQWWFDDCEWLVMPFDNGYQGSVKSWMIGNDLKVLMMRLMMMRMATSSGCPTLIKSLGGSFIRCSGWHWARLMFSGQSATDVRKSRGSDFSRSKVVKFQSALLLGQDLDFGHGWLWSPLCHGQRSRCPTQVTSTMGSSSQ